MVEFSEGKDLPSVSGENDFLIDAVLPLLTTLRYLGIACIAQTITQNSLCLTKPSVIVYRLPCSTYPNFSTYTPVTKHDLLPFFTCQHIPPGPY